MIGASLYPHNHRAVIITLPLPTKEYGTSSSRQPDGLIIVYFSCLRELSCFAFFYRQPLRFSLDALSLNNNNKFIETPGRYRCRAKYTSASVVLLA